MNLFTVIHELLNLLYRGGVKKNIPMQKMANGTKLYFDFLI